MYDMNTADRRARLESWASGIVMAIALLGALVVY